MSKPLPPIFEKFYKCLSPAEQKEYDEAYKVHLLSEVRMAKILNQRIMDFLDSSFVCGKPGDKYTVTSDMLFPHMDIEPAFIIELSLLKKSNK